MRKPHQSASSTTEAKQILPKDLLVHARKVEGADIAEAVANEIAKGRKNGLLPARALASAFPSSDLPGFGTAVVTIDGKDYIAQEINFEHRSDNFVSGNVRFVGRVEPRPQMIVRRDENGIPNGAVFIS